MERCTLTCPDTSQGENFQFDNEQRISRDAARLARGAAVWCFYRGIYESSRALVCEVQKYKMQVERFELFREDIEDLVKLTVDKMVARLEFSAVGH